jgi:hypothetical protein
MQSQLHKWGSWSISTYWVWSGDDWIWRLITVPDAGIACLALGPFRIVGTRPIYLVEEVEDECTALPEAA